jgi:hypothetical protein
VVNLKKKHNKLYCLIQRYLQYNVTNVRYFSKRCRMPEKKQLTVREFSVGFFRVIAVWIVLYLVNDRRVKRLSPRVQTCTILHSPSSFNKAGQRDNIQVLLRNLSQLLVQFEARSSSKHYSYINTSFFLTRKEILFHYNDNFSRLFSNTDFCFVMIERITKNHLLTYSCLLTHSMERNPSWKANRFQASQEIPRILWNPQLYCHFYKWPPPLPILSQIDPVHVQPSPTFSSWRSILILSSHLRLGLHGKFQNSFNITAGGVYSNHCALDL